MMGINHAAMGGSVWIALTSTAPYALHVQPMSPPFVIAGSLVAAGSALLADADHHNASIAHSIPVAGKIGAGAVGMVSGGHRHGTHSLLALILVSIGAYFLEKVSIPLDGGGTFPIGVFIATTLIVGFGLKAMKIMRGSWVKPFIGGAATGVLVLLLAPGQWEWFPWAVGIGYAVHLLGDFLTVGGLTLTWPWVPKPPKWWSNTPILKHLWMKNGYMAFPILGKAGSPVEYILSTFFYIYFAYGFFFEWTIIGTEGLNNLSVWWSSVMASWDSFWSGVGSSFPKFG